MLKKVFNFVLIAKLLRSIWNLRFIFILARILENVRFWVIVTVRKFRFVVASNNKSVPSFKVNMFLSRSIKSQSSSQTTLNSQFRFNTICFSRKITVKSYEDLDQVSPIAEPVGDTPFEFSQTAPIGFAPVWDITVSELKIQMSQTVPNSLPGSKEQAIQPSIARNQTAPARSSFINEVNSLDVSLLKELSSANQIDAFENKVFDNSVDNALNDVRKKEVDVDVNNTEIKKNELKDNIKEPESEFKKDENNAIHNQWEFKKEKTTYTQNEYSLPTFADRKNELNFWPNWKNSNKYFKPYIETQVESTNKPAHALSTPSMDNILNELPAPPKNIELDQRNSKVVQWIADYVNFTPEHRQNIMAFVFRQQQHLSDRQVWASNILYNVRPHATVIQHMLELIRGRGLPIRRPSTPVMLVEYGLECAVIAGVSIIIASEGASRRSDAFLTRDFSPELTRTENMWRAVLPVRTAHTIVEHLGFPQYSPERLFPHTSTVSGFRPSVLPVEADISENEKKIKNKKND